MTTTKLFTIHFTSEERERLKEFGKKHGYATLSGLIRSALDVVMRNPELLHPTEDKSARELLDSLRTSYEDLTEIPTILREITKKIDRISNSQEVFAKKLGVTHKELKRAQEKDLSGDAIFE